jgi:hypothetical protein
MQVDTRTDSLERKRLQLRRAMRKLKGWGEAPTDADFDPIYECYRDTRDEGDEVEHLVNFNR